MKFPALQRSVFLIILAAITVFFVWMIRSYLLPVFWSIVLAILFARVQDRLVKDTGGRRGLSAFLTLVLIFVVVVAPLTLLGGMVVNQAVDLLREIEMEGNPLMTTVLSIEQQLPLDWLAEMGIERARVRETLVSSVRSVGSAILSRAASLGTRTLRFLVELVVMLYILYQFLKDGPTILDGLTRYLPFGDARERELFRRFASTARATIKGTLYVGLVQGLLGGILFWLVGITQPVLWAALMALLSVIPALGSTAVWAPAGIILVLTGSVGRGVVVLVVGAVVISSVDNLLRPALVGKDTKMSDVLILVSTLGGISVFGVSGFVIGPIFASFFVTMWQMFAEDYKTDLAERG